jgi:hypothetical protein
MWIVFLPLSIVLATPCIGLYYICRGGRNNEFKKYYKIIYEFWIEQGSRFIP